MDFDVVGGGGPVSEKGNQPAESPGCCGGMFRKIMDFEATVTDLGKFIADMATHRKASADLVAMRKTTCETCHELDSKGERLFRPWENVHTCGIIRLKKLLRNSEIDGCGCLCELKWHGVDQHCPRRKW